MSDRIPFGDEVSRDEAEAIGRLSGELREVPAPQLDFDAMEAKLTARIDADAKRARSRSTIWWVAVPTAAAAAAAVLFAQGSSPTRTPAAPAVAVAPSPAPAAQSERVDGARSFSRPGFAAWSFDEAASADVDEGPERVTVRLHRGSVRVEVVPGQTPEKFVVVAAGTRVAVRGTVFKVALVDDVRVDVERGVVAVGPVDRPAAWTLTAPAGGSFSRDATTGAVGALIPFSTPTVDDTTPAKSAAPRPAPREAVLDLATLRERVGTIAQACFAKRLAGSSANVTFDTKVKLSSGPRGVSLSFSPPLEPTVEQCVREGTSSLRAQPGVDELNLSLVGRR